MASMSKEEYLKKYLSSGDSSENKKRKKKRHKNSAKGSGLKIVDDDVDFKALLPDNLTNTLEEDVGDNDPTVAAFIDERPEDVQQLEKFRSDGRWKTLGDGEDEEENSYASQHRHSSKTMSSDKQFRLKPDKRTRHDSDSDSALESKGNIRHKRHDSDSDNSLPRRVRHDSSDSDMSPPRSKTANHSPVHRKRNDSDSDISVSRNKKGQSDSDQSPPRGRHDSSDSDQSPQRAKHKRSDSDQSPPRGRRQSSDSDQSPPRKRGKSSSNISSHCTSTNKKSKPDDRKQRKSRWGDEKDEQGRVKQTLSGAKAGLSSAKEMAAEAVKIRAKEDAAFKKLDATLLGKDAATIIRDKSGRKRNLEAEGDDPETKAKKEAQKEQYQQWGKGLKQQELQDSMIADALHEVSKPLARAKDDADLDALLKEKDREGDPMLAFMKKKKEKGKKTVMPTYKGKEPEPNRFGIRPGYRWDGVDRSNGFERKFFLKINERKAMKDIAHKWSVEDM